MKKAFSFAAGALLAIACILLGILQPALQTARFESALLNTVNREAVQMSESDLAAFACSTMTYLRGETALWAIEVPFPVPDDFVLHMAEVRRWVEVLEVALPLGLLAALAGLWLGRDRRAAKVGMLTLLGLLAAVLLWAAMDFESLWMVIHKLFIPGGIFAAGEPIMQLFPLSLFFGYVAPAAIRIAILLIAVWLMLCYFHPKRRKEP